MSKIIYSLINGAISALDGGFIFIISLGLELSLFITVLLISVLVRLYSLRKRAWYFLSSLAVLAFELAFLSSAEQIELFYLSAGVTLIFWCVIVVIPERKLKVTAKQRELAKLLDQKAKESQTPSPPVVQERAVQESVKVTQNIEDATKFELDFKHVKTVVQKLEYYPLSPSDKKLVKELEDNIYRAETEGLSGLIKNKINDGLGALLKIMSKYGV